MRLLCFSDLHCDLAQAARLVELSADADTVICAGDIASVHEGLGETIDALRGIEVPFLLVPGNNETDEALRAACEGWDSARVLHGDVAEVGGVSFFGLGGGIPVTPWDWSFDLNEEEAGEALAACPPDAAIVVHSPPYGHVDESRGQSLGSRAILKAIDERSAPVAVCGHIHESWGMESRIGETRVLNLGPSGTWIEL